MNIENSFNHFGFSPLCNAEELKDLCLTNQPEPSGSNRGQVIQKCFEIYENLLNTMGQMKTQKQFSYQTLSNLASQTLDNYFQVTNIKFAQDIQSDMHICSLLFQYIQYWFILPMKNQDYLLGQDLFNYFRNFSISKQQNLNHIERILFNLSIGDVQEVASLINIYPLHNLVLSHKFIYPQGSQDMIYQVQKQREVFAQNIQSKLDSLTDPLDQTIVSIFCGNLDEIANYTTNWKVFLLCYLMLVKFTAKPKEIAQILLYYKQKFILTDTLDHFLFALFTTTSQLESIKLISQQSQYAWVAYLSLKILECFRIDEVDQQKITIFESKIRGEVIKTFCNDGVHFESLFLVVLEEYYFKKFDLILVSKCLRKKAFLNTSSNNIPRDSLIKIFQRYETSKKEEFSLNLSYWILHDFISEMFQKRNCEIATTDLAGKALSFLFEHLNTAIPNQTLQQIFFNNQANPLIQPLLDAYKIFLDYTLKELCGPLETAYGKILKLKVYKVCQSMVIFIENQKLIEWAEHSHFNYVLKMIELKFFPQRVDHNLMLQELIHYIKWPLLELHYSDIEAIIKFTALHLILQDDFLLNDIKGEYQRMEIINNLCRCQLQFETFCQFEAKYNELVEDIQQKINFFLNQLKKN